MKKVAIILVASLVGSTTDAFYGNQLIQKEHQEPTRARFLGTTDEYAGKMDEYTNTSNNPNQSALDEYDQQVCDEAPAPQVSPAEAMVTNMFEFMLMRYIVLKELARIYFKEVKDIFAKWFIMMTNG